MCLLLWGMIEGDGEAMMAEGWWPRDGGGAMVIEG